MTTIAIDKNYTLATDSRLTEDNKIISENYVKAVKYKNKIFAFAGEPAEFYEFMDFYKGKADHYPSLKNENGDLETNILVLSKGKLHAVDQCTSEHVHYVEIDIPYATGSGGDVALGAMLAGKTAKEAVLIASRVDCKTNSIVTEYKI
jgi:ATP-dependent protease HslVU (ClpYQ) peptidase subunit